MYEVLIDSISWERVNLTLEGHAVSGVLPDGFSDGEIVVLNPSGTREIALGRPDCSGERFRLCFNAMRVDDLYPLTTGSWILHVRIGRGEPTALGVDAAMSLPVAGYGGLFSARRHRYWMLPAAQRSTGACVLEVNYSEPEAHPNPIWHLRVANHAKRALRTLREQVYVLLFNAISRSVPKNGRRILFTSDSRPGLSGNLQHLHARMIQRGLDRTHTLHTSFKPNIKAKRPLHDKLLFPFRLATADVIVLDDYHPMLYKVEFSENVRIIQVWHASGAFKTVGYSRVGKPGGPTPFSASHKNYTHAIVSSKHDIGFYAEAFGIPESRVIPTGIPRMDLFFDDEHATHTRAAVYEALPLLRNRKVIVFAPTFRGSGPGNAYYDYELLDLPALHALCEEQDAVVVFKMHPFVVEPLDIPARFADRFIDATTSREINDLLLVADLVITDYSSLVFEYSTLNRPMLFFAYDLEEYVATRDFYEEFTSFVPGKIVRTFVELLDAIRAGDFEFEKVAPFAHEHLGHQDACATDRVIDQLILGGTDTSGGDRTL